MPTYSLEECRLIEEATRGQADSLQWFEHRRGRISASIAHQVLTKKNKLDPVHFHYPNLEQTIVRKTERNLNVPSWVYGRYLENEAVTAYEKMLQPQHTFLTIKTCGLFVAHNAIYMCAFPDRLVECMCCGQGLLEVKCPYTCINSSPAETTLSFVIRESHTLKLKKVHAYYTQVQMQMAITGRKWCDFIVYSKLSHVIDCLYCDESFCKPLFPTCEVFF